MPLDLSWDFSAASYPDADANADWILSSDTASGPGTDHEAAAAANTNGGWWCHTNTGSPSSSTGPPSGTPCLYFETSTSGTGQPAAGDIATVELRTAINASLYNVTVDFDHCEQGDTTGVLYFDAWDGTQWNNIDSWNGNSTTTFTSESGYDLSSYNNTDFKIRFREVVGTGSVYTNDFAVTNIAIYGTDKADIEQEGFRFYADGTESGSSPLEAQDTDISIAKQTTFQERVILNATGDPPSAQYQLEYKETSDPASEWRKVPTS